MATLTSGLTPRGFARLLMRGIQASFAPEHQQTEAERLVEYLQDLVVSRATEAELPDATVASISQARRDAQWLDAIAGDLAALTWQPNGNREN